MINFIYGRAGSGKTAEICKQAAKSVAAGRQVFMLVPEQMALDTEEKMTALLDGTPSLSFEILNFRRLCNHIFRTVGGLSYSYISKSGRLLLVWQTLCELAPLLKTIPSPDRSTAERVLHAITEFKTYCVSPTMLEAAADKLSKDGKNEKLRDKLLDLSLIYAAYTNLSLGLGEDADDDLTKAAESLSKNDIFKGADIFLDSFWGFTPQQFKIISELFRQADNVTVSLCLDAVTEKRGDELFVNHHATAATLVRLAERAGLPVKETLLDGNFRGKNAELQYLEKNLWNLELKKSDYREGQPESVKMVECQSLFAECEAVATDICRRVREGSSWRDFAIVTRGLNRYDGILDVMLDKYGIPHFISARTDIKTKPVIKLILSALSLYTSNFECEDLISYIKTGLCGITPNEVSVFENYIHLWNIRGRGRLAEDFTMNPGGYTAAFTADSEELLEKINSIREAVLIPIFDFHGKLREAKTAKNFAAALYSFLLALELPATLQRITDELRPAMPETAQETEQLWSVIIDALDELCTVMGETEINVSVFAELLKIIFDETDIGRIPATLDSVVCGDASLLRADTKHMYIIGANDGIFPASPSEKGIFSDSECDILSSLGVELAPNSEYVAADERFLFYRAASSASESLTLLWSTSDLSGHAMKQSFAISRLKTIFKDIRSVEYAALPLEERIEGSRNILEFIAEAGETSLGNALREYASSDEELTARLNRLSLPLCDDDEQLDSETAAALFGGNLSLTQSRLESFVLCKFSYFCKYALKLEEKKSAEFNPADIGSFIHHILEKFVRHAEENGSLAAVSEEELDRLLDGIVSDYMTKVCRIDDKLSGSRIGHLFARLKRSSRILCKNLIAEFSESEFSPKLFELSIGRRSDGEEYVDPFKIPLADGTDACVYGIADRVDVYKKDDKFFVRVVDYKTGSKEFSLEDLKLGLNMQMLLYLFSIWKNGAKSEGALSIPADKEILPAGVLYFSAGVPTVTLDHPTTVSEVEEIISHKLPRKGILLDDPEVLEAMETGLSGKFIPVKPNKDGVLGAASGCTLASLDDFGELLSDMENTVRKIGEEMKAGKACAKPLRDKKHDGCAFCQMRPICRKDINERSFS